MSSKRQQIIDAIIDRMETIQTAGGFETDLGDRVRDWETNWQQDELPALSVCDTVADISFVNEQPTASLQEHDLPVMLRIFAASDTRAEDLRKMLQDVIRAIGTDQFWNDGTNDLALWTRIATAGIIVPDENFEIGGAAVEITIRYLVTSFDI